MTQDSRTRVRQCSRRLRAVAVVAAVVAVLISAVPGTAVAGARKVVPLVNCYYPHSDGSVTVVLGYRNTHMNTRTIDHGGNNYTTPSSYGSQLPTTFEPGTHNGVATMRISARDLRGDTGWYLDGTTLSYATVTSAVAACTEAQLPAFANGATIGIALLGAGLVGVLVLRRVRRNLVPGSSNPSARGGHSA